MRGRIAGGAQPRRTTVRRNAALLGAILLLGGAGTAWHLRDRAVAAFTVGSQPVSYELTYDVTQNGEHHWEVLSVHRPLTGSDLVYTTSGPPRSGDHPVAGSISTPTALFSVNGLGVHRASGRQPGPPSGDQLLGRQMAEMLHRGLAVDRRSSQRVAGQTCRMVRLAEPPSGAIRPVRSMTPDHDDVCLGPSGLVLAETWTYHGAVVLQRTAVTVQESNNDIVASSGPVAPGTDGATPQPAAAADVTADPQAPSALSAPSPPTGFATFEAPVNFRLPDPNTPTATVARSRVWTFVNGGDVITVEAGITRGGQPPWRTGDTVTVRVALRGLGRAETAVRSDGSEVRVDLGARGWVRVRGTVPVRTLADYAQGLRLAAAAQ